MEELLTEVSNRFVLFPIRYNSIWSMYKKAESAFWTAEEIDLSKDIDDWNKLSDNERHFIKHILAFFAGSDGIVNENLSVRFMNEVKPPEAKAFYGFQIAMENIHCVTGDTLILTSTGYHPIHQLVNKTVDVWNGECFSKTTVKKTSESSEVMTVVLSNGMYLTCTRQHKWLINGYDERVYTENLKEGMILQNFEYPIVDIPFNEELFSNVEEHAIECLDTNDDNYNMIKYNFTPKYMVPINFTTDIKLKWIKTLFKFIEFNKEDNTYTFRHHKALFCNRVQLLLTTINVKSTLTNSEEYSDLTINANELKKLEVLGVTFPFEINPTINTKKQEISIVQVIDIYSKCPTFCFNEPIKHTGIFNGVLTGQSETYSLLIDSYIKDPIEKHRLQNAINTIPCIAKKADWALKWIEDKNALFSQRLVAFACIEGIFFSGAFCAIFWLKERGLLPGLCLSNEFISRDESLHTEFAILLYSMLQNKLDKETIYMIVKEAVEIEDEFINDSIPCSMLGMNRELMSQYIKFVADRLLIQLGYDQIWSVKNPFGFMDRIGLDGKDNFFEHTRNSNYAKANIGNTNLQDTFTFTTDAEF